MAHIQGSKSARSISEAEAAELVKSDMWLDYGFGMSQPDVFDQALAARKDALHGVKIRSTFTFRPRAVLEADETGKHFQWLSWHFSGYDRNLHDAGRCTYIPMNFGEAPGYYRRFIEPVDIAIIKACPKDENGIFNFSCIGTYQRAMLERARVVIIETSDALPYVHGHENGIHESQVDYVIEGDGAPMPVFANTPVAEDDIKIASSIAAEIKEGACLQIGIGGIPNAVCSMLKQAGLRDLGIHTEFFVDGIVELYEAGLITGTRKHLDKGKMVFTFAAGSQHLYDTIDHNPDVECRAVDYTNLPHNIMQNDDVVSINSTTQMDLQGQAVSETAGHRHLTGTGGQLEFARGAYASRGGKSFICLPSTYTKDGQRQSRIVAGLAPGNIVTTPRTDIMFVVTEYGMVNLKAKSVAARAKALISIAHPDFREGLECDAREKNIIPKTYY